MNESRVKVEFNLFSLLIVVQIVFLILKLCGVIAWPWACVLIPLMIVGGILAINLIALIILFIIWRKNQ